MKSTFTKISYYFVSILGIFLFGKHISQLVWIALDKKLYPVDYVIALLSTAGISLLTFSIVFYLKKNIKFTELFRLGTICIILLILLLIFYNIFILNTMKGFDYATGFGYLTVPVVITILLLINSKKVSKTNFENNEIDEIGKLE